MKYERNPATVHAEQLVPGKIRESIEILDGFLAGGSFDYNLDAENDEDLAAVLTCTHRSWETLLPGMWVVRWAEGEYTIMGDEEFRRDFRLIEADDHG